ncbi:MULTISPECIES: type IV secretion system DNA-binding domain-containing protein [Achromobacter]|uniref:type IV secretion system DNA-binding domain-containing protein n=1 Tax=Achromobacter TaxID=222 RepID=UPI000C256F21|nr:MULTISPECIES: type IV secretion system DNA-binding domain-containing protein [Achromobacter]PJM88731.1 type VI secretion protein [Achromobacter ruhlandii]BEG77395.1 Coupling protein TraD [Achromobacter xylosoxidans]
MAPDIRRRIIKFAVLFFPLSAWLVTAKLMSDIPFNSITWRVLSLWVQSTPHHTPLVVAPVAGFIMALVLAFSLKRYATSEGFDGAGYKKHIRGTEVVPLKKLEKLCTEGNGQEQVIVAGVPMPLMIENLHLLIAGATGSGKSVLLRPLVLTALRRGDRAVIVDPDGSLYSKFGRPEDVLLNPYDQRTEGWSFFNEVRADYDWKRLAMSVVPLGADANAEEWNSFGRLLLREAARKLYELGTPSIEELFRWCTIANDKDLRAFLSGTLAESLFAGSSEATKALSSARFVLSNKLSEHMSMPAGGFSIRDWMDGGTGCLYITWRDDMKQAMKPLLTAWVDVFLSALLSMSEDEQRRWWLFIDELASLEKLASLEDGLTKGRKPGLRVVAGLQSVSQLDDIYGKQMSQTLRASFRSLVVLGGSKTDPETAEEMSKALGEHEVARPEYTDSRNPGSSRNTSERLVRSTERVVTPAQIQALPHLTGWLAFAGNRPISKFVLEPQTFAVRNAPFVEARRAGAHSVATAPAGGPSPWNQVDLPEDPTMAA